jgi:hypothetical protein
LCAGSRHSPVPARDNFDEPIFPPSKLTKRFNPDITFWSPAKRQSFTLINTNPNGSFYRRVAPNQIQRTDPWNTKEKRLFLEAIKVHPPSTGKWSLFATDIPGKVGYQWQKFYHHLLQSGELKAQPSELETIKRSRSSKNSRKVTSVVEVEMVEETSNWTHRWK